MVENYILAVDTISKKLDKDHPMYPFMVCSLYGLLCKYHGHEKLIISLLKRTDVIFEPGTIEEILERHNIEQDIADPVHDDESSPVATQGVSNPGHSFVTDAEGNLYHVREKPFVICSTSCQNITRLLNTFCHEMGHLIKGEENCIYKYNEDSTDVYVIRTGLSHNLYSYNSDTRELTFSPNYSILDEAINCIQTTDVMSEILALREFVDDERIIVFIDSLDYDDLLKDHGYEDICILVRKLWENDSFKHSIEDNIVLGNIDTILEQYDSLMGEDAFDKMSCCLDAIYSIPEESDEEFNLHIDAFVEIANEYKKRVQEKEKVK